MDNMNRTKQIAAIVEGVIAGVPDHVELIGLEVNLKLEPYDRFEVRLFRPEGLTFFALGAGHESEWLRRESQSMASQMPPVPEDLKQNKVDLTPLH